MTKKQTVLVVDDESYIRKLMDKIFTAEGFKVLKAENGEQAIEIFKKQKNEIDLVIMDLIMPGKSGIEVYKILYEMEPAIKVILCTGCDDREIPVPDNEMLVRKPFRVSDFRNLVRRVIDKDEEEIRKHNCFFLGYT